MTDDQLLLASAYVDDDLDAAERARAEADPDVMAEVDRMRRAIAALRDVEPPPADQRDRAIAAALGGGVPVAPPTPLRPRRAWWAGLGVAAAAVLVVAGGIAVVGSGGDGGDDSASIESPAGAELMESSDVLGARPSSGRDAPSDASGDAADAAPAPGAGVPTTVVGAAPTTTVPALAGPDELAAFAADPARQATSAEAAPACADVSTERYVGPATYTGTTPPVAVEVVVAGAEVLALDAATCAVVARAPLP